VNPIKVLYMVGSARSGSSLLARMLGEIDGFFAAAEMRLLWHGLDQRVCGCGRAVGECPVWSSAIAEAEARAGPLGEHQVISLQSEATRARHVKRILRVAGEETAGVYRDVLAGMYAGAARASGARVIVDSSKASAEAALLLSIPDLEPYLVQVVRDPRAVAYSWMRVARGERAAVRRRSTAGSAVRWLVNNRMAGKLRRRYGSDRSALVRYEDLVENPEGVLRSIVSMLGENSISRPEADESHMVGGNPLRFRAASPELAPDFEWKRRLSPAAATLVTVITSPLLGRYGYPVLGYRE